MDSHGPIFEASAGSADQRRDFGAQVAQDVAVWMVLAFATAQTDFGPLGPQTVTFYVSLKMGGCSENVVFDPQDQC